MFKKIIFGGLVVFGITVIIALAGIYKFGYLSSKNGYDVDGNKIILEKENIKENVDQEKDMMKNNEKNVSILISPQEFKQKLEMGKYVLVDIRTDKEDKQEKIPGTKLILDFYKDDFVEQVSKLDKNKKYLYYCRTGHRSGEASDLAGRFNFTEAYELDGGIVAWKKAGYKTDKTPQNLRTSDFDPLYTGGENVDWYKPKPGISWQWQLDGSINTSYKVALYDVDLVDTSQNVINKLHSQRRKVICYFSAGSWEDWRPDARKFPKGVIGKKMEDWAGEKWLNISQYQQFAGIMQARMDLAVQKKCDGIEPDNIDGFTNKTGFKITAQDQLRYNKWLANEAHKRGLAIALKNDIEQAGQLVNYFDFAINEQCFEYNECAPLQSFIKQGKAVLGVEYELKKKKFCSQAKAMNFSWLKMDYDLNGGRDGC
jgi:rhodanese-related sulfurtransferase